MTLHIGINNKPLTNWAKALVIVVALFALSLFGGDQASCELVAKLKMRSWYSYANQLGSRGFFGSYDIDNGSTGDFAPANGWLGANLVSGANAATAANFVSGGGEWKYNDAVKISGAYQAGQWLTGEKPGPSTPLWPAGHWTIFGVEINSPIGLVKWGKLPFAKGCGLQYGGGSRTEEFVSIETNLTLRGPWSTKREEFNHLMFGLFQGTENLDETNPDLDAINFHNSQDSVIITAEKYTALNEEDQRQIANRVGMTRAELKQLATDATKKVKNPPIYPGFTLGFGFYPWQRGSKEYWNVGDLSAAITPKLMAFTEFSTGPIEIGIGSIYSRYHEGPESQTKVADRIQFVPLERTEFEGWAYLKYCNGRYFFETETDWFYRTDRYQRSLDGTFNGETALIPGGGGSRFAPDYIESWRFMAETGLILGPYSFRLLYAYMPGPDRRHGVLIDKQPFLLENGYDASSIFSDYSSIMAGSYGAGIDSPSDLSDAHTFGFLMDYAIAANLHANFSAVTAIRDSDGYGWGYIKPNTAFTTDEEYGKPVFTRAGDSTDPAPAIPSKSLGWEFGGSISWILLNQWRFGASVAFWRPGDWFKYACIDRGVNNWDNPTGANLYGVNHDRAIDPIITWGLSIKAGY